MGNQLSAYCAGVESGRTAYVTLSDFEMSSFSREFTIGYIVGHSNVQSLRFACPDVAALTAGELGYRYGVSTDELLPALGFDEELTQVLLETYENEHESSNDGGEGGWDS